MQKTRKINMKNLSQNLKRFFEIQGELESRNYFALRAYNTGKIVHKKQLEFHKSKKRNRWVFGGNRTGKTECGAVEAIWMARGNHPFRENRKDVVGWVVSLSQKVQKEVAQEKILKYLNKSWIDDIVMRSGKRGSPEFGVIDTIVIKNVFGGLSRISFKSAEEGREKFQGTSLDFVWFDEEPPEDIYVECRMRVIDKCGDIFGTMTPLKGLTFVYNQIYLNERGDDEVFYVFMDWSDNPFLSAEEVKRLSSTLSEAELENRKFGRFSGFNSSLVYSEFDEKVHVIDPFPVPFDWQENISIDPGLSNPLSAHFYAVDFDGNIYVVGEHYESNQTLEHHAQCIHALAARLGWKKSRDGKLEAIIDSAANQKTLASPRSVSELFFDYGIKVNPKVNKDLFSGINRVKSYLKDANGESKLFVFRTCENMIREFKSYFWGKADAPIKKDDHSMDELRYFVMTRPENKPTEPEKSWVQKDKERLFNKLMRERKGLM
ncbi:MAG: terminase family protein [Clostridia bacterium]|nr:terminase family protein [Clostridia bacterium]